MSSLTIEQYPNIKIMIHPFLPVVKMDLHSSVRSYLSKKEELTRDKALTILRDIKWKTDLKAFLLKPIVLVTMGLPIMMPYIWIPAVGVADIAYRIFFVIGALLVGMSIDRILENRFWEKAYNLQSKRAGEYISDLEMNPSMTVKLAKIKN